MYCENCKERPASVILKQESMEGSVERHLCEKCAFHSQTFQFDPSHEPLSIQQFLAHWFGGADPFIAPQQKKEIPKGPECPECHLTFSKFLEIGKFGCATCYDSFRALLPRVLGKLHNGHSAHIGKVPESFSGLYAIKRKLEEIRVKMQEAVEAERFEEAAELRDEANRLKERLDSGGGEYNVN
ncbi:UvrB/UvrC motif-containing protein [Sporosarcina sp. HYO08]|uniref:UvrB/UvrC motif-containing protein n=1 Tax=Sporosarcina sp. HYO08 TaxID=1759557 RepID=UPI00079224EC|nr:UvrB/UvrC motif-containing protein [Sporosarcina sp. HYO08]KXH80762.1 hypothetical protein AU377_08450 [Sporosarcina sp. HYO08]